MCRAVTCLSYCIAVTTKSLLFAAEAYPKLEPTLRFLDLVSLRIRRGTLRTDPAVPDTLDRVPLEAWDGIRYELIKLEQEEAEERVGAALLCADCLGWRRRQVPARKLTWELYPGRTNCEICHDRALDYQGIADSATHRTVVDKMLRPFCLRMATDILVRNEHGGSGFPENDPDTAVLLTTALASDGSERDMSTVHSGDMDICYEQTVTEIEPLRRPDHADARFAAFVSRFHLEPVDIFDKQRRQQANEQKQANTASKHIVLDAEGSTRVFRRGKLVPAWRLFMSDVGEWWMCRATTHIFFGLPLSTSSLVPAADAWPKLVKTLPFFDLITLRILSGTSLRFEVWDVVKHKLVDLELQDANDQLMRNIGVNDWSCWGSGLRKPGKSVAASALPPFWTDICSEAKPCDMCSEGFFTFWDEISRIERFERLQGLLSAFDLFAPSKQPLMPCDDCWCDPQSATYVALLSEKGACTSLETNCACDSEPDEQRILKVDFGAMQTSTRQARQRFLRLIRLLHLEPLRIATSVVRKNVQSGVHRRDVTRHERSFTVLPVENIEPKWLALTVSVTDW